MIDVSGFGTSVFILALSSFPTGFEMTEFADDTDPLVAEEVETSGFKMMYDGTLFAFDKASAILVSCAVPAGSDDDINFKIMLQARKGTPSIIPLPDVTSMIISYPNNGRVALSGGSILSGQLVDTVQTSGRKKSNVYKFAFGTFAGAQSPGEIVASIAQAAVGLL